MRRTPNILTRDVLAKIPEMVASGQYPTRQAIADALGCKLATLQVRCSQRGISLRMGGKRYRPREFTVIKLDEAVSAGLRKSAYERGITESDLARRLLEVIARDNLYDAVLDEKAA